MDKLRANEISVIEQLPGEVRGKFTHEEILSQPEAWTEAIEVLKEHTKTIYNFWRDDDYQQVIFTGCGSTYFLSLAAASQYQALTGREGRGLPASELWIDPEINYIRGKKTLLVAISRSGETSETIRACEQFLHDRRGKILTLVCKAGSPLTKLGDLNLEFPSGMEKSVAQTRAFSTMYLAVVGIIAIWANQIDVFDELNKIPNTGKRILALYQDFAAECGKNLAYDRIYFLGSGGRLGLACELSLKMKEMSLTHSEAFHFLEFRHGPKAMVNPNSLVIGLVSQENARHEEAVLKDVEQLSGMTISIGEINTNIHFTSGVKEVYRNILYLPFGQMLAYERSIAKGLDPDRPTNLDAVVQLTN